MKVFAYVISLASLYAAFRWTLDSDSLYRKDPHMQNSMRKQKLTLTLTLTDTGGAVLTLMLGFRSLYITWQ